MKEKYIQLPTPLRKQVLLRCAGTGLAAAMLLIVLIYSRYWRFMVPCAVVAALCLGSAALLFDRCLQGKYVVIAGVCTAIERTRIRKRIKAIYLQTEEHQVKLAGVRPIRNLVEGDTLNLYVAENTPVYNVDGCNVICSYITLEKILPTAKKKYKLSD